MSIPKDAFVKDVIADLRKQLKSGQMIYIHFADEDNMYETPFDMTRKDVVSIVDKKDLPYEYYKIGNDLATKFPEKFYAFTRAKEKTIGELEKWWIEDRDIELTIKEEEQLKKFAKPMLNKSSPYRRINWRTFDQLFGEGTAPELFRILKIDMIKLPKKDEKYKSIFVFGSGGTYSTKPETQGIAELDMENDTLVRAEMDDGQEIYFEEISKDYLNAIGENSDVESSQFDKDIIASRQWRKQFEAIDYFGSEEKFKEFLTKMRKREEEIQQLFIKKGAIQEDKRFHGGRGFTEDFMKEYRFSCSDDGFQYFLDYLRSLTDKEVEEIKSMKLGDIVKKHIKDGKYCKGYEGYLYYILDGDIQDFWNDI